MLNLPFFQLRFVGFSMYLLQLIGFDSDGTTTKVAKGTQQMGYHPTKNISINIFSKGQNGLIHDCENIFIDKTDPSDPTRGNSLDEGT